jgi:hypothetical protein
MLTLKSCYSPPKFAVETIETLPLLAEIVLPMKASKSTILLNDMMDSVAGIIFAQLCQRANVGFKASAAYALLEDKHICTDAETTKRSVFLFIRDMFEQCELEYQCLVSALIYLDRMQNTNGFRLNKCNWRSSVAVSLLLSSKMLDDFSVDNNCFAWSFGVDTAHMNLLENTVLTMLQYSLFVSAAEYSAYHSAVRAMADNNRRSKSTLEADIMRYKVPYPVTPPQRIYVKTSLDQVTCDVLKKKRGSEYISPYQSPTTIMTE